MTQQSRLETAQADDRPGSEWYRSPLALLAGLILSAGVLALIVVSLSVGDDSEPADGAASFSPAADIVAPPPVFGGDTVPEIGIVTVIGDVLPPLGDGEDPAIGLTAPVAHAMSLGNGADVTLGGGRARVIGFFAHWCPHCQAELPEIAEWLVETQLPANSVMIAVSTAVSEERGNYPPSEWFNREGWPSPVVVDDADNTLLKAYGFTGFPAFIAIDATGTVVAREVGNIGADGVAELFDKFAGAAQS